MENSVDCLHVSGPGSDVPKLLSWNPTILPRGSAWKVPHVATWSDWLDTLRVAEYPEEWEHLVKRGFNVFCDDNSERIDRLEVYLGLADGHAHCLNFLLPGEIVGVDQQLQTGFGVFKNMSCIRQQISVVAFQVLCSNVLSDPDFVQPDWRSDIRFSLTLRRLMWFFRPHQDPSEGLHNTPNSFKSVDYSQARKFAFSLCQLCWNPVAMVDDEFKTADQSSDPPDVRLKEVPGVRDWFAAAKPVTKPIFERLGKPDAYKAWDFSKLTSPQALEVSEPKTAGAQ